MIGPLLPQLRDGSQMGDLPLNGRRQAFFELINGVDMFGLGFV
jgi:hypothetical protein